MMPPKHWICCGLAAWFCSGTPQARAGTVALARTPILTATLPTNTTYQVESSSNGSAWVATGVLVAGSGTPVTVRLDGFSASLAYRCARIGTTNVVLPAVTNGWNIAGNFPAVREVRVETNSNLTGNSWALRDYTFPDATGAFVRAVRLPLPSPTFFRGVQPATPLDLASVTSYTADTNVTVAGYGLVADDMPQIYRNGAIAAVCPAFYNRDGANAAAAGECYELTGPNGTATVMVADVESVPPPGTCDVGHAFFDIAGPVFTSLFADPSGFGTATYRLVPTPVVGNVKMVVVQNSAGFYLELRPYNHRTGITKVEIQPTASATWLDMPRATYNSFVYSGSALTFPVNVRVTSRFGEVVSFPPINAMPVNARFTASAQFVTFPNQTPAPVWILPPVYTDSLSNVLGGQWSTAPFGGPTVNATYAGSAYQGAASMQINNLAAFSGVIFLHPFRFPRPPDGALEFAVRSGTTTTVSNLVLSFSGYDALGTAANSTTVFLPPVDANWRVLRIPLAPAFAPEQLKQFRLSNNSSTPASSVLLDGISFQQP